MGVDRLQRRVNDRVSRQEDPDTLILWESLPTYTAGSRTKPEDIPDTTVPVIPMDRGGSVTYHGPGQLVVYPIVRIAPPDDLPTWVRSTERAIMAAVAELGVTTVQIAGRSGVWVAGTPDRKLCAIGMKFRQHTSMHGLALNVTTDLHRFSRIVPCGITDAGVVSLADLGINVTMTEVARHLTAHLEAAYEPFAARPSAPTNATEAEIDALLGAEEPGDESDASVAATNHFLSPAR